MKSRIGENRFRVIRRTGAAGEKEAKWCSWRGGEGGEWGRKKHPVFHIPRKMSSGEGRGHETEVFLTMVWVITEGLGGEVFLRDNKSPATYPVTKCLLTSATPREIKISPRLRSLFLQLSSPLGSTSFSRVIPVLCPNLLWPCILLHLFVLFFLRKWVYILTK